jgi:thioredoxin-like negative regulator of GroEL
MSPRLLLLCVGLVSAAPAAAAPFVPTEDAQVLERLPFRPSDPAVRELQLLHAQLVQQPGNQTLAVAVARRYIELGRVTGDPRYAGYAQAALSPWWSLVEPPRDVLLLRATLRQRVHQFDAALGDLARALARNPRDVQARLTRATVLQVRGEFEAARQDCQALQGLAQEVIAVACLTSVGASSGRLHESYKALQETLARYPGADPGIQSWLWTGLGEMAARAGLAQDAERHFKSALAADSTDQYLLGAYADFLLDRGRVREAAALVQAHTRADGLLLRYALALKAQGSAQASQAVQELRARFDASRMRGDRVHLREEARFELHLDADPQRALELAKDNWAVQKEPADARILLEAALVAKDGAAVRALQEWLARSRMEDVQLRKL